MCEVLIATGEMFHEATDFDLPGHPPFLFERSYSALRPDPGPLGTGWRHNWQIDFDFEGSQVRFCQGSEEPLVFSADEADGKKFPSLHFNGGSVLSLRFAEGQQILFQRGIGEAWLAKELVDPQGHSTQLDYNGSQLVSLRDTSGRAVTFTYAGGLMSGVIVTHRSSRDAVAFGRDSLGRLIEVSDSIGTTDLFEYNGDLIVRHTLYGAVDRHFCYDENKRCIYNWYSQASKFRHLQFASDNRAVLVIDSYGFPELFRLDDKSREIAVTDPLHRTTQWVYANDGGLLVEILPGGMPAETGYIESKDGRDVMVTIDARGAKTSYELDEAGRSTKIQDTTGQTLEIERDEHGNTTAIVAPDGGKWTFGYDLEGALTRWTTPVGESIYRTETAGHIRLFDDAGDIATYEYNENGNLIAYADGMGRTTRFSYFAQDLLTELTLPDGRKIRWDYDSMRRICAVIDAAGNTTRYEYSIFGTPIRTLYPDGAEVRSVVDLEDNVTQITNSLGEICKFSYDEAFRLSEMVCFDGRVDRYEYDEDNEICRYTTPAGDTKYLTYDGSGNVTELRFSQGLSIECQFDELERLTSIKASAPEELDFRAAPVKFKYNASDYVTAENVGDFKVFYDYDLAGNLIGAHDSLGRDVRFVNQRRLVRRMTDGAAEFGFEYLAAGEISRITMPNGMEQRLTYDICSRLIRREVYNRAGALVAWRSFVYDNADQLSRMVDWRLGERRYRYNNRGRLVAVLGANGQILEEYDFDSEGNLRRSHDIATTAVAPGNRLSALDGLRIRYDEWGNIAEMSEGGVTTRFTYSLLEHLDSITRDGAVVAKYEYDLLLRRTRKITADDDVRFYYHANLLSTLTSARHGRWDFLYVPDLFIPLSQAGPSGRFYYSFDQIGTPTELWDENGNLVATISSEAFGARRSIERIGNFDGPVPFHFACQYVDEESGLHYNLFRYYWPEGARFLSQDPSGLTAGLNLYTYPLNPMNWIDPLGLAPVTIKLSCKPREGNFTPCEQKALEMKVTAMNAELKAQPRKQRCTSCRKNKQRKYFKKKCKGTVPKGYQVDHVQELQLGGADKCCKNLMAIPARPNGSAGGQIHAWLEKNPNAIVGGISLTNPKCTRAHECTSDPTRRGTGKDGKGCEDPKPIVC